MNTYAGLPHDCHGVEVQIGAMVRVLSLSGDWYNELPPGERTLVDSIIGEVLQVEAIDQHGQSWVCKRWPNRAPGARPSHSIALKPNEMLLVFFSSDKPSWHEARAIRIASARREFKELMAKLRGQQ